MPHDPAPAPTDTWFLDQFDLTHPAMTEARALKARGEIHAAALAAAKSASAEPARGAINEADIPALVQRVRRHLPRAIDLELETLKLLELPEIPSAEELGYVADTRIGIRARVGRRRGNDALMAALVYALTAEIRWADLGIRWALASAAKIQPLPDTPLPPAYGWHPRGHWGIDHDDAMRIHYWLLAWPMLNSALAEEDRLAWLKVIVRTAEERFRANRHEIPFNLTLHGLLPALQAAAMFPTLKHAPLWRRVMIDRMLRDFITAPSATPDGYSREGASYHNVNTRMFTLAWLTLSRTGGEDLRPLRAFVEKMHEVQQLLLLPDGTHWLIGDGMMLASHEHWQDSHEALHLAAALFDRPDFKASAGSPVGAEMELLNAFVAGPDGLDRWAAMPPVNVAARPHIFQFANDSGLAAIRHGSGLAAHAGLLCFSTEHNHAHHDKGQVLLYGLGRLLLSDTGVMDRDYGEVGDIRNVTMHSSAAPIRRSPLGPRTDRADLAALGPRYSDAHFDIATGSHTYFENHIIHRALILVKPTPDPRAAFWLVWDRITWQAGWPTGNEPLEMIDTRFAFHAPGSPAALSPDGRTAWSQYAGPDAPPFLEGLPRRDAARAQEYSDSDANLQVTRLAAPPIPPPPGYPPEQWDLQLTRGVSSLPLDQPVPRPVAIYRWRGKLPHVAAYVLIPFTGMRSAPFADIDGHATADGLHCRVNTPTGSYAIDIAGLLTARISATIA